MTKPDELPVDSGDEEPGLDPAEVTAARAGEADEADLIEQAYAVPLGDDERGVDR
jgi:hypothetical protein